MRGPLSDDALRRFAEYLSDMAGCRMVLDADSPGHEIYDDNRARYQFAVEGGRPANYQGVVLKATGDPEVWIVWDNQIWAGYHIRETRDQTLGRTPRLTMEDRIQAGCETVLPRSFADVLAEFMSPYEDQ